MGVGGGVDDPGTCHIPPAFVSLVRQAIGEALDETSEALWAALGLADDVSLHRRVEKDVAFEIDAEGKALEGGGSGGGLMDRIKRALSRKA